MQSNPLNEELHQKEREAINQVRKWRQIEGMALLQKARIPWLKNRDDNIVFYHATIKERRAANSIYELLDKDGKWIKIREKIQLEIKHFYQNL